MTVYAKDFTFTMFINQMFYSNLVAWRQHCVLQ